MLCFGVFPTHINEIRKNKLYFNISVFEIHIILQSFVKPINLAVLLGAGYV